MKDVNGKKLTAGAIVEIKNAFFKNDNGYWFVENSVEDPNWSGSDYCLHKLCKNGKVSTARHHIAFWPLCSFCSDPVKNAKAHDWNRDNASIEIIDTIPSDKVSEFFAKKAEDVERRLPRVEMDFGKQSDYAKREKKALRFYKKVAAKLA